MLGSMILQSPSTVLFDSNCIDPSRSRSPRSRGVVCNAQRSSASIPKLESFSRSRIDRRIQEPEFLQKCENDLTEYCSTLEGDDSYSCWRAYFELKDLEKEMPKEDVEKFVRQTGGRKSLIECLHGLTAMEKKTKNLQEQMPVKMKEEIHRPFPVPDGLPKTLDEIEEEERAKLPDSPFTRLLRSMGKQPAWYSEAPDHETD
ncbi:uncharacterized protein A4U43_C07F30670 [Asparagus officinalis]|uniref:CCG-binding protein 1 n=1 Tax=Asparagus officinalis TaxID=4686 RepID=A0A5P1EG91_ASPOF|nr:CCG-binding protein 1 [Asparagus officinalis]ONK64854.1 uncharacterized protein A4U43_C07F30670 [Asparagus officinalis]